MAKGVNPEGRGKGRGTAGSNRQATSHAVTGQASKGAASAIKTGAAASSRPAAGVVTPASHKAAATTPGSAASASKTPPAAPHAPHAHKARTAVHNASTSAHAPKAPAATPAHKASAAAPQARTAAHDAPAATPKTAAATPAPKPAVAVKVSGGGRQQESADEAENRLKARKGALFLGVVVIAYVVFLILSGQMGNFIDALGSVNMDWVWGAFACYGLYFVFGVLAYVIAVYIDHDSPVGVRDLMSVEASGVFFGNLTPMAAGSIPSQIVRLTRTGLDPGEASATQFTRFIMFQLGVVLFAAIMLAAKLEFFFQTYGDILILNLIVFSVHLLELVALFVICLCPNLVMRGGNWGIKFLSKHHLIKDETVKNWSQVVNVQVMEFSAAFKRAASDLPSMALTLLVTMCQLACLYVIPWFVLQAFGKSGDFLECLAAGSMVEMVTSAVPLPGGTGGAEGGFLMFYGHMFGEAASAGFLVWRIAEFYLPTFLAVPLLGLRTKNRSVSIYHRVQRIRARLLGQGGSGGAPVASYRPRNSGSKSNSNSNSR